MFICSMNLNVRVFIKVYVAIGVFFLILFVGTCGYMAIEHYTFLEALYMTVITLATIGYSEVHPLSSAGRLFTIVLTLANLGTFTYFIAQISSYFLDGEFTRTLKLVRMEKAISELKDHVIICGFGRNGREAAKIFAAGGKPFVVIEQAAPELTNAELHVPFYLQDNATRDEALVKAGISSAAALITTLPNDADNLFVVLTARELNNRIRIVSRASHDTSVKKLKTAGANNVIMPDKIGGAHMATLVLSPDVKEFMDLLTTQYSDHFAVQEIMVGKTVSLDELDCWKATGATVLGIKNMEGDFSLNPVASTVLRPGNRLIAMGARAQLDRLANLLN